MPRYDRNYNRAPRGFGAYDRDLDREDLWPRMRNRVTARYNRDYVLGERGPEYPRNPYAFTGDREARIGDNRYYWMPYQTTGGTRTHRGSAQPIGYDLGYAPYDRSFRPRR